ncbi:MAG: ABC transporter ATP-binding protein [Planctomycetota bacterium]
MTAPPLTLEHVDFSYPGTPVFRDLTLTVGEGEFTAVLGPNGSGKTTLVRLATRVVHAARGRILLGGDALESLPRREVARRVAVVPQEEPGLFAFSVMETVLMGRTPWVAGFGFESEKDLRIARESLAAVDAEHLAHRGLAELSGGERQRVLLARALAQGGGLLVLDEPTAHLDLRHQVGILRLLRRLREKEGRTVLAISHDVSLTSRFAERLVLLSKGGVVADGPPSEVLEAETLSRVYGTRITVKPVNGLEVPHVFPE